MNGSEFLVAANMVRDYDWVVLPPIVGVHCGSR
jgi:hypothetical protein